MNIYIFFEIDYEKNSHLCEIYQSRQVEKDDKAHFYEYGNAFQCNILQDTTFLLWLEGQTFISEYSDKAATVNVMLKYKVNGNCKRNVEAASMQLFWHTAK